jgi:hypothetical protein
VKWDGSMVCTVGEWLVSQFSQLLAAGWHAPAPV